MRVCDVNASVSTADLYDGSQWEAGLEREKLHVSVPYCCRNRSPQIDWQQKFITLQSWRLEIWNKSYWARIAGPCSYQKLLGKVRPHLFRLLEKHLSFLRHGLLLHLQSASLQPPVPSRRLFWPRSSCPPLSRTLVIALSTPGECRTISPSPDPQLNHIFKVRFAMKGNIFIGSGDQDMNIFGTWTYLLKTI